MVCAGRAHPGRGPVPIIIYILIIHDIIIQYCAGWLLYLIHLNREESPNTPLSLSKGEG